MSEWWSVDSSRSEIVLLVFSFRIRQFLWVSACYENGATTFQMFFDMAKVNLFCLLNPNIFRVIIVKEKDLKKGWLCFFLQLGYQEYFPPFNFWALFIFLQKMFKAMLLLERYHKIIYCKIKRRIWGSFRVFMIKLGFSRSSSCLE